MALSWGKRTKTEQGAVIELRDDAQLLATFTESANGNAVAEIDGEQWTFERDEKTATATNGRVTYEARTEKGFKQAKVVHTNVNLRDIDFINEQKSDWILDENDQKLGQFTGANRGVRHVSVDLEPDAELEDSEKVFLAWIARLVLEEKLVGMTWMLSLSLLVVSAIGLITYFV